MFSHLICTRPVEISDETPSIIGLSLIHEIGSRELVISLTDKMDLVCAFVK